MKYRKIRINVPTTSATMPVVGVDAYTIANASGLCTHRSLVDDGNHAMRVNKKSWTVSHVWSGLVIAEKMNKRSDAFDAMVDLSALDVDWMLGIDALKNQKAHVREQLELIRKNWEAKSWVVIKA